MDNFDDVLRELMDKYSSDEYACEPPPKRNKPVNPVDQKLLQLVEHQLENNLSLKSAANTAKLMNGMPGAEFFLPETRKQIKNRIERPNSYDYFVFCTCKDLVRDGDKCEKCKLRAKKDSKKNNFIVSFQIIPQIKAILANSHLQILEYLNRKRNEGFLTDIDDGIAYNIIQNKYPNRKVLSFTMNSDGATIHRSSKHSLWITQIYQNYLPPDIRFRPENILVVSLYYGTSKPDPISLLAHFARELDDADLSIFDGNQLMHFIPIVVIASADIPARAMLQNMMGHAGKCACPVCLHPGIAVKNKNKTTTIRYLKHDNVTLRTHDDTVTKANKVISNGLESIDGIKGLSCMLLFNHFDVIENFAIDFMHGIGLGITKYVVEIWLGVKKIPQPAHDIKFKLKNPAERKILEKRILQLKPLMNFRRKPKSIFDIANFKATELINFLLYYSRFATINLLPNKVIKHFELLSAATFILCKQTISNDDITQASDMLIRFADLFEEIYGKCSITMNIHMLRHYGQMCRLCGPLWSNSLFGFESNIGAMKKFVCGTTDVLVQMAEKYSLTKSLNENNNKHSVITDENLYQAKQIVIDLHLKEILSTNSIQLRENEQFIVYRRLKQDGQTYTSKISTVTKSADYFLKMSDNAIGTAEFFFKNNKQCFVLLNNYEIVYRHHHISEVKPLKSQSIYPCKNIEKKLLFLTCAGIQYTSQQLPAFFMS